MNVVWEILMMAAIVLEWMAFAAAVRLRSDRHMWMIISAALFGSFAFMALASSGPRESQIGPPNFLLLQFLYFAQWVLAIVIAVDGHLESKKPEAVPKPHKARFPRDHSCAFDRPPGTPARCWTI